MVAAHRGLQERRKNERIPLAIPVFVRGKDSEGKQFLEFATLLNISTGGALLAIRTNAARSSTLSLEIPSAPPPRVAPHAVRRLAARLVWATSLDNYRICGIKFKTPVVTRKVHSRQVKIFSSPAYA